MPVGTDFGTLVSVEEFRFGTWIVGINSLILGKHFLFPESTVAVEQSPSSIPFVSLSMTCPGTK